MDIVERLRLGTKFDTADKHEAADEIEKLRQQRDELQKDAERYRWLRDQKVTDDIGIAMKNECINGMLSNAENIDSYIDAAIAKCKEES